jgi:hypothetical protein
METKSIISSKEETFIIDPWSNITDNRKGFKRVFYGWLLEIIDDPSLHLFDSMSLAILLFNKYISKRSLTNKKIQLYICACMYIACKYVHGHDEEEIIPDSHMFVSLSCDAFTEEQLLKAEIDILTTLDYQLEIFTLEHYIQDKTVDIKKMLKSWIKLLMEDGNVHTYKLQKQYEMAEKI